MKSNGLFCLRFLLICVVFGFGYQSISAQNTIYYSYDDNGNRVTRSIALKKSSAVTDSAYEETEKEIFKDEIGEIHISIYPNPTKGNLVVEVSGTSTEALIEYGIYSATGTILKKQIVSDPQFNIDFTNQPCGMYILKLNIEGKISEWKIIKE